MWTVLGTMTVMGILVLGLNFMARSQNAQAHRVNFGEVAENLAEAGIEHVGRRVRDALFSRSFTRVGAAMAEGPFFSVFLLDNARLRQIFDTGAGKGEAFMQRMLGRDYRFPLDVLLAQIPGSTLKVTLVVDPQPLVKDPIVIDPVEKRVRLVLRSQADYRGVTRVNETGYEVKVVHPFPPVSSKFTLFAHEADTGQGYNTFRNDPSGLPYTPADFTPVVFNNTPPEEVQDLTLIRENLPHEVSDPFGQMPQVREALDRRGWIYLGTGSGTSEIHLNMAAGPVLMAGKGFGEHFHLFDPLPYAIGGMDAVPAFFTVMSPPPFFGAPIVDPVHPGVFQRAMINFLYFGYHYPSGSSNMRDGTLGKSLQTESSSAMHLYGTHSQPSRTKVFGNVFQDYARFGYLAVDHDITRADEETQKANLAAAGLPPYVRERDTRGPAYKFSDAKEWEDDLRREQAGQPMTTLATVPPSMPNSNFATAGVVLDPGWPDVPLDPASYKYAKMFEGTFDNGDPDLARNHGYARFMSQIESVAYDELLDFMYYGGVIPPQSNPLFREPTLKEGRQYYMQPDQVTLTFHDPLHDQLAIRSYFSGALSDVYKAGSEDYGAQTGSPPPGARSGIRPPPVRSPSPAAAMLLARTYREFRTPAEFMAEFYDAKNNLLYLTQCVRIREGDLLLPAALTYAGAGAVVLMEGSIVSNGLAPVKDASTGLDSVLTLATLTGDIILGAGAHRAAFCAPAGSIQHPSAEPLRIEGTFGSRKFPAAALTTGGTIAFRGVYDPLTDLRDPTGSAYIDYYQIALSDVPMDWHRVAP